MPANRRSTIVVALLIIVLAISLIYNGIQSTAKTKLSSQNQSLGKELENLRGFVQKELYPAPASVTDITKGKDILAIPLELNHRPVQIVYYNLELADSGWLVIDLPFRVISQVPDLDITLYYRDQDDEKNPKRAIYPTSSAKDCFNQAKQRLEIPVSQHLSLLCGLRLSHENGASWSFRLEDSKLVWKEN